jgi:hypothetical protein
MSGLRSILCIALTVNCAAATDMAGKPRETGGLWFNDAGVSKIASISGEMYQAIAAVVSYRINKHSEPLQATELVPSNFNIEVRNDPEDRSLQPEERGACFAVAFRPRYAPGESVLLDSTHTSLGRAVTYVVRKTDYSIVRATFVKASGVAP